MSYVVRKKKALGGLGDIMPTTTDVPKCAPVPCIPVPCKQGISGWMLVGIAAAGFALKIIQFGRGVKV